MLEIIRYWPIGE